MNQIDQILDRITMYRLVLYYLIGLILVACALGFFHVIAYSPLQILFSTIFITAVCYITNFIFSYVFEVPTNVESIYITALILALIVTPTMSFHPLITVGWIALLSQATKYILAIGKKHIFNPAAVAVFLTATFLGSGASWWVGTAALAPFVFVGGILVVRKIRRVDLVFSFCIVALITILIFSSMHGSTLLVTLQKTVLDSSLLFLAFVMLTEPLTTPPTKHLQILYGILVGFLFAPQIHLGSLYTTPESALLIGNMFAFMVNPADKVLLVLQQKIQVGADQMDFIFHPSKKLSFIPGQYMEWTLQHPHTDSRGNRRYFTIASSPSEDTIRLGVKFYPNGSSYKKAMQFLSSNTKLMGASLAGDFILPKDASQKLVFIAGGIGITPFRSIIKYLIDTKQKRDIILMYSNKIPSEIMYQDVWGQAQQDLHIKTIYTLTDTTSIPQNWNGEVGRITPDMIKKEIPDYNSRIFYLSGPHAMVNAFETVLKSMGVSSSHIKIDFFPGFV